MERREHIETRLREALSADHVDVVDESHLHAGHAGAASGGGHFRATIVSPRFAGLSRVARQRLVFGSLAEEMGGAIHALSMRTFTPEEWADAERA
jgi:BolA protein